VNRPSGEKNSYTTFGERSHHYQPQNRAGRAGNGRGLTLRSEAALNELFTKPVKIHDFALQIKTDPDGVWDLTKDMYFVSMLPDPEKEKLKGELLAFASSRKDSAGNLAFDFHMRRFDVD